MNVYPAMLKLKDKLCIVIGGGKVATRKVASLLEAEAKITVISPIISGEIVEWARKRLLTVKEKEFESEDIRDAFIVIAATNQPEVNNKIIEACQPTQLINAVDNPSKSNFIVPSTIRRGKLTVAVSTDGASPGLTRKIKSEIASSYDESYEDYIDFLDDCRKKVKERISDQLIRSKIFKGLLDPLFLEVTRKKDFDRRNKLFESLVDRKGGFLDGKR